jgi:hypothetical protein
LLNSDNRVCDWEVSWPNRLRQEKASDFLIFITRWLLQTGRYLTLKTKEYESLGECLSRGSGQRGRSLAACGQVAKEILQGKDMECP